MFKTLWMMLLCGLTISAVALAAPTSPSDRESIEQQQRELLRQNQQQREELQNITPILNHPSIEVAPSGACFTIDKITLEGSTLISRTERDALLSPYLHQCLDLNRINLLVQQVSDWYMQRGYITSRAFLSEQDLATGELTLLIMEGHLEKILIDNYAERILKTTFPGLEGKILNLRDVEQGMEQLNRTRKNPVKIEILPSEQAGYSIVNLTGEPEFPVMGSLGFDNSGQKSTGTGQLNASLTVNNVLGLADQWFVSGARSSDFAHSYNARSVQAGVSLPYGYWLFDYNYSYSDYQNTILNNGYDWASTGDTQTHRLNMSRVLYRDGDTKTSMALGITHRIGRNYLNDSLLESSSRKLSSVSLGVNHGQKLWSGFATFNPSFTRGVPWLGAEDDKDKRGDVPRAEFSKWSFSGSYYLPLAQDWTYLTSIYGQWSENRLYGSERLTIGGESSVRGFKEQYLSGDNGGYWRNEINYALFTLPWLGNISSVAAVDGGYLRPDKQDSYASGTLWGASIGLSSNASHFYSQLSVGWPLSYPDWLKPDRVAVYYRIGTAF